MPRIYILEESDLEFTKNGSPNPIDLPLDWIGTLPHLPPFALQSSVVSTLTSHIPSGTVLMDISQDREMSI